jgi:CheY-like chemotaxis protein
MEAVEMTRPRWKDMPQRKGVVLKVEPELDADLPEAMGIPSEIREAIVNLILNSVDAMQQGGTITIRTGASSDAIRLEVIDQGIGMDEDTRMRCLEPFFSTKGEHGTGMGLASVFGTMKRHEGKVQVESEPGRGAVVRLLFPMPVPASHGLNPLFQATARMPHPFSAKILCIDDDDIVRNVVRAMLMSGGHEIEEASGGRQGIDVFRKAREAGRPFDLVITDLGMPHVDGKEVARTLKGEVPGLPIILLTGWGSQVREEGSMESLVDRVLSKPPEMEEISAALLELVPVSGRASFAP